MDSAATTLMVFACISGAVLLGVWLRRVLPEHHLNADSREAVKLAMGLVATMSALLLGLLISSAKGSFDAARGDVAQMAAKVALLDRMLEQYGPEAGEARERLHTVVREAVSQLWPDQGEVAARLAPDMKAGGRLYHDIQRLSPRDDTQQALKAQAATTAIELAQLRTLLMAQATPSISQPLMAIVASWLVVIFLGFSVVSPANATTGFALLIAAMAVTAAVFLILELDRPFDGLLYVSAEPFLPVMATFAR